MYAMLGRCLGLWIVGEVQCQGGFCGENVGAFESPVPSLWSLHSALWPSGARAHAPGGVACERLNVLKLAQRNTPDAILILTSGERIKLEDVALQAARSASWLLRADAPTRVAAHGQLCVTLLLLVMWSWASSLD